MNNFNFKNKFSKQFRSLDEQCEQEEEFSLFQTPHQLPELEYDEAIFLRVAERDSFLDIPHPRTPELLTPD